MGEQSLSALMGAWQIAPPPLNTPLYVRSEIVGSLVGSYVYVTRESF